MLQVPADVESCYREICGAGQTPDFLAISRAAKRLGLKAGVAALSPARLLGLPLPAIVRFSTGDWAILAKVNDEEALYQIPGREPATAPTERLGQELEPQAVLLTWRPSFSKEDARFGLVWFAQALWHYRPILGQILLASFVLQLLALGSPLIFQVVTDKVLPSGSFTTLNVIAVGLIAIAAFEAALGWLRTYLTAHTSSRLDVQLGSALYRHLLQLPLSYFQTRPAGQTVARVRELESVREFLTGAAVSVLLDFFFSIVAFTVLCFYNVFLAVIVAGSLVAYFTIAFLMTPLLRGLVEKFFQRAATSQSFLVESVAGAETIKAMALEPAMIRNWEGHLAAYVAQGFRLAMCSNTSNILVNSVSKITNVAVLWAGVTAVHNGSMTIGEFIAFTMISGQLTAPVLRLAQLWQQFQQARVGVERLGDILNTPVEPGCSSSAPPLPKLSGRITFEKVSFRYTPGTPFVLRDLSFDLEPGSVVGIIGRSGSGKSSITKLIQRLYVPSSGRVLIDGYDLAMADPAWLRTQIGVVLQDNFLFNRSVRENIAIGDPSLPMERIAELARLAGAHEFIMTLPQGYDTIMEERGTNLSGGQRQRIAIARALATNPRILIFDEATSALDYESESRFHKNLGLIARDRTVILIAHRLSTVERADRILGIDAGDLVEDGTPDELHHQDGLFAMLQRHQFGT